MAEDRTIEDDLRAAFDAQEEENDTETPEAGRPVEDTEESVGTEEVEEREEADTDEPAEVPDVQAEAPDEPAAEPEPVVKPPAGWTPAAREHWAGLPDDVKAMVTKREGQIAKALEDSKENRKMGERFNGVMQKYGAVMAAEGVKDPIQGIEGLMNSVAGLRMGTASQKAQIVAEMVKIYGVDIGELDNVLSGNIRGQQRPTQNAQIDELVDQRLAPFKQFMDQVQQQKSAFEQQQQAKMHQEIDAFASTHEFYNDVYLEMADLLDVAAKNGRQMTMEQAYNIACQTNPEIAKVTQQRQYTQNIAQKRQAASSISGKPAGNAQPVADDLRGALLQAWEG